MKYRAVRVVVGLLLLLVASALLMSCAGNARIGEGTSRDVVWPSKPSMPRIAYSGSVSQPEDLGISKGLFGILKAAAVGEEDSSMILPMAVVPNGKGQLFVSDSGRQGIHKFDTERGKYQFIKRRNGEGLISPVAMAVDQAGKVYITDSELAKVFVIPVGAKEAEPLQLAEDFVRPTGIAIDSQSGWIYVVDTGNHAVYVFKPDNTLIKKFGRRGTQAGEFNFPTYLWQNKEGNLIITDSLNFRIQMFDRFGGYIGQFGSVGNGTGDQARPKGVAEDSEGHIYVTDSLFHTVQIFDESGNFLLNFGEQGSDPGQFWLPAGIHISQDGTIYVADSYNKRVQIFHYIGSEL